MSKKLSNGLMSLKFMQNAQRAKQQAQVELEQAKIKDEAEWEVSQEIKDAWGIGSSSGASTSSVVHESSYLPFLFTSSAAGTSDDESHSTFKGRRSFNAKGKEIETEKVEPEPTQEEDIAESQPSKRITSISGFRAPLPIKSTSKSSKGGKGKSVQELLREDTTKRAPAPLAADKDKLTPAASSQNTKSAPIGFLKPAGVDAPSTSTSSARGAPARIKRDRDDAGDSEGKKRKRKKDKSSVHMVE